MISLTDLQFVRNSNLPASAKLVLYELVFRANDRRICWPSIATIASDTSLSKSTVRRALKLLVARELIQIEQNPTGGSNNYRVFDMGYHDDTPPITMTSPPLTMTPPPLHNGNGGYHYDTHENNRNRQENHNEKETPPDTPGDDVEKVIIAWTDADMKKHIDAESVAPLLKTYTADQIIDAFKPYSMYDPNLDPRNLHRILKRNHPNIDGVMNEKVNGKKVQDLWDARCARRLPSPIADDVARIGDLSTIRKIIEAYSDPKEMAPSDFLRRVEQAA